MYQQFAKPTYISVWIDRLKTVKKLTFQNPLLGDSREVSIIGLDEAKEKLTKGGGIISKFGPEEYGYEPTTSAQFITLNQASLDYLDDRTSGFIHPVFVFKGVAIDTSGQQKDIVISLPAVK